VKPRPVTDLLVAIGEPTRLRILTCVSTAPLLVADLAAILHLPEATVMEQLEVLEELEVVRPLPLVPHLLYTLAPIAGKRERLLHAVLDAVRGDAATQTDRAATLERSRSRLQTRVRSAVVDAT
jgi:DNA-binding transcriptional ArsR family regulator